jgi:hypothetical protein
LPWKSQPSSAVSTCTRICMLPQPQTAWMCSRREGEGPAHPPPFRVVWKIGGRAAPLCARRAASAVQCGCVERWNARLHAKGRNRSP